MEGGDILLQDTWTYRFHDPGDADWTMGSYLRLADMSSVEDFWEVHAGVQKRLAEGMFFVMREHVFPCWDDPANLHGGCLSLKVLKTEMHTFWEELLISMLGEVLMADEADNHQLINGVSTSPKRHYCIVKLWLRDLRRPFRGQLRLPCNYQGELMYKTNADMMRDSVKSGATGTASRHPGTLQRT